MILSVPDATGSCDLVRIRHDLHQMPEIGLCEVETSAYVANLLRSWGYEVERGYARTGVVARLQRGGSRRSIAFRADMDALPIEEKTGKAYASRRSGVMHACGHDGHMTMLLGAAHAVRQDTQLDGSVTFIFQPAEENHGGASMMIEEGLFERFPADMLFALHNLPGLPTGRFSLKPGPIMASIDVVSIVLRGRGGHGAQPEETVDPIVAAASLTLALQTLVSRNVSPHSPAVVTVGRILGGTASNIIPDEAMLEVSIRATDQSTRALLIRRIEALTKAQAESFACTATLEWQTGYPPTINDAQATHFASDTIAETFGSDRQEARLFPLMASEDCAFFLERVPGAFVFIGNGDSSALHTATYDFNDAILADGARYFHSLASRYLG